MSPALFVSPDPVSVHGTAWPRRMAKRQERAHRQSLHDSVATAIPGGGGVGITFRVWSTAGIRLKIAHSAPRGDE